MQDLFGLLIPFHLGCNMSLVAKKLIIAVLALAVAIVLGL